MYILYADESGAAGDRHQRFFVLAGIAIFDRQTWWLSVELDKIVQRLFPHQPEVELHGSHILQGKGIWRSLPVKTRIEAYQEALGLIKAQMPLFGVGVERAFLAGRDPVEYAFEEICRRFDKYLRRHYTRRGDRQRGLIVFDKTSYETYIQGLAAGFRTIGHRYGRVRNLSEVPLFLDSRVSRLVQLADLIAYALFRFLEHQDERFFPLIEARFDAEGGVCHGLHVKSRQTPSRNLAP
ncbi:MAG: DUF3800 domain-containing protein [Bryobacteraceae bacterium]|nr:DUF3800 domain-containing protein [Bryobacteraceae bacterium]